MTVDYCARQIRVLTVAAIFASVAVAGCATDEPASGTATGQVGGAVSAVTVSGDQVWLGAGERLQGVDVADAALPLPLGQSEAVGEAIRSLVATGDTVLAAAGTSGLLVFDVGDPTHPHPVTDVPTTWAVNAVALDGTRAYLAEGAQGLRILDMSDPTSPLVLGSADTPGDALGVAVGGEIAYVADWGTGVRVIDVSDPAAPREIASIDTPGEAVDVALGEDDLLFVADRDGGLRIVDVSVPTHPDERSSVEVPGAERLAVEGDRVYVAAGDGGLVAVDVADPDAPRSLGQLADVTVAMDVVADGARVYVGDVGAAVPQPRGAKVDLWAGLHMWGVQGRPEVAEGLAGLHISERTDDGLAPVGMFLSPSLIESAAVDEDAAVMYLADGHAGLLVLDLGEPSMPAILGSLETPGVAHDVILRGDLALVADGPGGLLVVDVAAPRDPIVRTSIDTPGEALGIATLGEIAYVADGPAGLRVVDLARGEEIGAVETPGMAWDVAIDGTTAYVSDRPGGMRVYDLSDPAEPRELAVVLEGQGDVLDVVLDGDVAWVSAGPSGVHAYDVSDPAAPEALGRTIVGERAIGLLVDSERQRAYVAAGTDGLRALDIADPSSMRDAGSWEMPGAAERLTRFGDWVYVAAEMGGLQVVPIGGDSAANTHLDGEG